ncbi:MAG: preprotein translocase subunit SecY [Clostridiales bacterium]|nr:preprotein translocase subunit SecY [Clostridiales bacterium]
MFETIKNCFKVKEIRKKIFLTLILLLIFRLGCYIPVPGIKVSEFRSVINDPNNAFLGVLSSITGGSLANATLFALGISPYINASIIIQLLTVGIPALERMSKEGEDGRKKIAQITRFVTIALAIAQAIGIIINFGVNNNALRLEFFGYFSQNTALSVVSETGAKVMAGIFLTVVYTAGAMLVMWLGERITEYGVSNGISLIIFVGIISTAGLTIVERFTEAFGWGSYVDKANPAVLWEVLGFVVLTVVEFAAIVTVDLSERRIPVQYAKQVKGRKMYGGQSSVIPIKISGSGVMPLIFAFALISFPQLLISLFWPNTDAATNINIWFSGSSPKWYGQLIYMVTLCLLIFAFSFFYQSMQFNPEDVSKTIQQNGGFIQGIRPGKPTSDHLKKISNRITLFGAIYLSLVAFIPSILSIVLASLGQSNLTLLSVFSTTGILIVVSVAMELDKQLESQLMMKTYKGFLK